MQVAATETLCCCWASRARARRSSPFLHRASARSGGSFIALNCAALRSSCSRRSSSATNAARSQSDAEQAGQLEQAGGGTLFLDEVGEMAPAAQAKFLRVLQEREFQRLGGTRVLRTDARVVARPTAICNKR